MKRYLWRVGIAADQLFNAVIGGYPDETLSSRAFRESLENPRWDVVRACIDRLFFWQKNHCEQSHKMEVLRSHMPDDFWKG